MDFQGLDAVVAACGIVPAHPVSARHEPQPRRDAELIKADQKDEDFGHDAAEAKSQISNLKSQKSGKAGEKTQDMVLSDFPIARIWILDCSRFLHVSG